MHLRKTKTQEIWPLNCQIFMFLSFSRSKAFRLLALLVYTWYLFYIAIQISSHSWKVPRNKVVGLLHSGFYIIFWPFWYHYVEPIGSCLGQYYKYDKWLRARGDGCEGADHKVRGPRQCQHTEAARCVSLSPFQSIGFLIIRDGKVLTLLFKDKFPFFGTAYFLYVT